MVILTVFVLALASQNAQEFVEKLRSESVEERDVAETRLRGLGRAAVPSLERAAEDRDPEVSARARRLLRFITVVDRLTERLRKVMPGVEARLASGGDHAYTEVFLEAAGKGRYGGLGGEDIASLVIPAAEGMATAREKTGLCRAAGQFDLHEARTPVAKLLEDSEPPVREAAIEALVDLHARDSIPLIAERLGDRDESVRQAAIEALLDFDARAYSDRIVPLLEDSEKRVRMMAACAVVDWNLRQAVPVARRWLASATVYDRDEPLWLLQRMGAVEAVPDLLPLLRVRENRREAFEALARLGAVKELRSLLWSDDEDLREGAAVALAERPFADAVPELRSLLKDSDRRTVNAAATALGKLGVKEAIPEILRLLREGRSYEAGLEHALASLGAREAVPLFREKVAEAGDRPCWDAAMALWRMKAREAAPEFVRLLKHTKSGHRGIAAEILGDLGIREAAREIAPLLEDPEPYVRTQAALALGHLGAKEAVPALLKRMTSDREGAVVVQALALLGAKECVPRILRLIEDPKSNNAWLAPAVLRELRAKEAVPELMKLLDSKDDRLCERAVEALAELDATEAVPALVDLLSREGERGQGRAAAFLAGRGRREGAPDLVVQSRYMASLNALRCPGTWKRLGEESGGEEKSAAAIAKRLGLPVEGEASSRAERFRVFACGGISVVIPARRSHLELLELSLKGQATFILEPDRIRILPHRRALIFWREWWDAQQNGKK